MVIFRLETGEKYPEKWRFWGVFVGVFGACSGSVCICAGQSVFQSDIISISRGNDPQKIILQRREAFLSFLSGCKISLGKYTGVKRYYYDRYS